MMINLRKDCFQGKRCFVIASGPSLKHEDLEPLRNEITIAVNESYKAMPFLPTFIAVGDYKLWPHVKDDYAKMPDVGILTSTGLNGTCGSGYQGSNLACRIPLDTKKSIMEHGLHWDLKNRSLPKGYNIIPELVLPFACYAGFSEAYLLGCDFQENGYAYEGGRQGHQLIDARVFPTCARIAATRKPTRIVNLSQGSALKAFQGSTLRQVLSPPESPTQTPVKTPIKDFQFVGYYTPNQDYKAMAERMQKSVQAQGLPCDIYPRENLGAIQDFSDRIPMPWVLNCSQCAEFCLTMFDKYPEKHIFYLDVDARMVRYPKLLESLPKFDIAAPFLTNQFVQNELTSNALIFRRTPTARKILVAWKQETTRRVAKMLVGEYSKPYKEVWDQKILSDALRDIPHRLFRLPWEYAKITLTPNGTELMEGINPDEIVIEQYQSSRWNKRTLGAKE